MGIPLFLYLSFYTRFISVTLIESKHQGLLRLQLSLTTIDVLLLVTRVIEKKRLR